MAPMMIVAIRKQKEKQTFLLSIAMLVVSSVILYCYVDSLWVIAGAMLIYFIAFNFLEATMPALISRIAPANQKLCDGDILLWTIYGSLYWWCTWWSVGTKFCDRYDICRNGYYWGNMVRYRLGHASATKKQND